MRFSFIKNQRVSTPATEPSPSHTCSSVGQLPLGPSEPPLRPGRALRTSPLPPVAIRENTEVSQLPFHPAVSTWLEGRFGRPTEVQSQAWAVTSQRHHVLIAAPTGSGKTL